MRVLRAAPPLAAAALVALAAGAAGQPRATSVPQPIPWSERRLIWSDFAGRPDMSSDASATTAYVITYESSCLGLTYTFTVTTTFMPDRSWVKPTLRLGSPVGRDVLDHEQIHFDLGEVHARELRRALGSLHGPCEMVAESRKSIVQRVLKSDETDQRRYDEETASGLERDRQREWAGVVARRLRALTAYAQ